MKKTMTLTTTRAVNAIEKKDYMDRTTSAKECRFVIVDRVLEDNKQRVDHK